MTIFDPVPNSEPPDFINAPAWANWGRELVEALDNTGISKPDRQALLAAALLEEEPNLKDAIYHLRVAGARRNGWALGTALADNDQTIAADVHSRINKDLRRTRSYASTVSLSAERRAFERRRTERRLTEN